MARFAATINGNVPYSAEREAMRDAEEAAWEAGTNDRAWKHLREKRNRFLHESDWWASSDLTITQAQKDYRSALRDLPANTVDPANPTWPIKPGD